MLWNVFLAIFRAITSSGQKLFQIAWKKVPEKAKNCQKLSQTKKCISSCHFFCSKISYYLGLRNINFEDINFRGWPNFKHFGEINFWWWPLFEIVEIKTKKMIHVNEKKHLDFYFVFLSLLFIHFNKIYKN